jgi:plasmid stabilization system protein ParE
MSKWMQPENQSLNNTVAGAGNAGASKTASRERWPQARTCMARHLKNPRLARKTHGHAFGRYHSQHEICEKSNGYNFRHRPGPL